MIRKLLDLSEREVSMLFEVEYEILPVLHSVGVMLNEKQIRDEILAKPNQSVLFIEDGKGFIALLRFVYEESNILVTSLNIRRQTRKFLRIMYECFKDLEFDKLMSTVQLTNKASFSFHYKLGLEEVKRGEQAVSFEITKEALINNLRKYL